MKEPIISVIVPVYNAEQYLRRCIDSICAQTFEALEIILVDDGSTDGSREICEEYVKKDDRIRFVGQQNQGVSSTRNKGLDMASGKFIGFVDSDDWIEPDMYQVLFQNLCDFNADISACIHDRKMEKVKEAGAISVLDRQEAMITVLQNRIIGVYTWNKLYKKELFNNVRYPKGRVYEDSYVILDLLESISRMVIINAPLYHYTKREGSISNTLYNKSAEDRIYSAKKNMKLAESKYPALLPITKDRYINAHYTCLKEILREPPNTHLNELKKHSKFLQKNLLYILFVWRKSSCFKKKVTRFVTIVAPRQYQWFCQNMKKAKRH